MSALPPKADISRPQGIFWIPFPSLGPIFRFGWRKTGERKKFSRGTPVSLGVLPTVGSRYRKRMVARSSQEARWCDFRARARGEQPDGRGTILTLARLPADATCMQHGFLSHCVRNPLWLTSRYPRSAIMLLATKRLDEHFRNASRR
jgi:hypothetical protein